MKQSYFNTDIHKQTRPSASPLAVSVWLLWLSLRLVRVGYVVKLKVHYVVLREDEGKSFIDWYLLPFKD